MSIHPTAIINAGAELGENVEVGPYAVIEENVAVGDGCRIGPHVHICGHTTIGAGTRIYVGANVGDEPQDLHYHGQESYTEIGRNCVIREYATIHRGSEENTKTVVGDGAMLMGFAHVGHNCTIGNEVVIANGTLLAGHVDVGERAFISGGCLIQQFVRIGRVVMVGGGNKFSQDIPPYCMLQLEQIQGANVVGLKRCGVKPPARKAIRAAIKTYFFSGLNRSNALAAIREEHGPIPEIEEFATFIENTRKGIVPGRDMKARK
ncbi:MAG: acyl-ACP--UDP-N-acetylglucosamine O-acyltransferase [Lentisphaeria bacterium]|nr:acyl-ACP--UDP-N-acetylglucosamine O-acyltransferase [Lentisphaeria bacterium]